jgi:ribokinase
MSLPKPICVFGACNIDLIAYVTRFPAPGETIKGKKFQQGFGGKGANQAVAAANLGSAVYMVSKVGNDVFGRETIANFQNKNVNTDFVFISETHATGCAPVIVQEGGENAIVIVGGANDEITECELQNVCTNLLPKCSLLLCQLEVPIHMNDTLLEAAHKLGIETILNIAPASSIPPSMLKNTSILIANETEINQIVNENIPNDGDDVITRAECTVKFLYQKFNQLIRCAIVTLGGNGCIFIVSSSKLYVEHNLKEGEWRHENDDTCVFYVPVPKVEKVIDTTGLKFHLKENDIFVN